MCSASRLLGAVLARHGPAGSVNAFDVIKPEKTTQLDVGMQYRGDKVDAWVSGYAGYVRTSSCSTTGQAA